MECIEFNYISRTCTTLATTPITDIINPKHSEAEGQWTITTFFLFLIINDYGNVRNQLGESKIKMSSLSE